MLTGNKGEWSELYVFAKLLSEGRLYQSDINLNRDEGNYYEVIKAYREDKNSITEYSRANEISIYNVHNAKRELINKIDLEYFRANSAIILKGILSGKGKSFEIPEINDFTNHTNINKLTALVSSKSDIKLKIYDHRLAREADLGFSIKSLLGQDSTLLNTGPGNNFIYRIENNLEETIQTFNAATYKPEGRVSKITARLQRLTNSGLPINFKEIQSKQFWRNLKMVDGDLPNILAFALLYRWLDRENSLKRISEILENRDPLNFYDGEESTQKLYEYKLKKMLAECAMGMTSETPWEGVYDATGGVIIAKEDGDVVCFHIYDFNLFREYLLNNTIFEQPSTGEDEDNPGQMRTSKGTKKYYYGWLYQNEEELNFKINLQIRFR